MGFFNLFSSKSTDFEQKLSDKVKFQILTSYLKLEFKTKPQKGFLVTTHVTFPVETIRHKIT